MNKKKIDMEVKKERIAEAERNERKFDITAFFFNCRISTGGT